MKTEQNNDEFEKIVREGDAAKERFYEHSSFRFLDAWRDLKWLKQDDEYILELLIKEAFVYGYVTGKYEGKNELDQHKNTVADSNT